MGTKDISKMTVKDCKLELGAASVAFKANAKVEELRVAVTKLREGDRKSMGINPLNDPVCDVFGSPKAKNQMCIDCATDLGKRNEACLEIAQAEKAKSTTKITPEKRQTVKAKYADFGELKTSVEKADDARLTMFVDKLLVKGGLSFAEMLTSIEARKAEIKSESTDFKNVAIIKKHIKYRATKGWVFTIFKNGKVKATDYTAEGGQIIDKTVEEPAADEKKAA